MHRYGFSTGALALGDFERGLDLLRGHGTTAVELSALRDTELPRLMDGLCGLDLTGFEHISIHAPSRFVRLTEAHCAELLHPCIERGWYVILHPDVIASPEVWAPFRALLCIENMDERKPIGRTAEELAPWFELLPEAGFCLDLGHARQVDPTLGEAREMLRRFGHRLQQIHLSELNATSGHEALSHAAARSFRQIADSLPAVAVILESCVPESGIAKEIEMARSALEPARPVV